MSEETVFYSPEAEQDLIAIAEFIARDKPIAALEFVDKLEQACATLATNPGMGEVRQAIGISGCRSFSVGN